MGLDCPSSYFVYFYRPTFLVILFVFLSLILAFLSQRVASSVSVWHMDGFSHLSLTFCMNPPHPVYEPKMQGSSLFLLCFMLLLPPVSPHHSFLGVSHHYQPRQRWSMSQRLYSGHLRTGCHNFCFKLLVLVSPVPEPGMGRLITRLFSSHSDDISVVAMRPQPCRDAVVGMREGNLGMFGLEERRVEREEGAEVQSDILGGEERGVEVG
ncbi:hypothetical protein BJ165DRAFT_268046 [Panaeolus papilionaceus]|nr:hypothetical protein BJ165DRAFT_268046 [Panaeolus papilionaceus]